MVANAEQINSLLRSQKLAATPVRRQVLGLLCGPGRALSSKEIEQAMGANADRVTIYRTLKVLCEHDIVHKIIMDNQEVKYKLIEQEKGSDHPHFYCANCNQLLCLSPRLINTKHMPDGFSVHSAQLVMEGICSQCNDNQ